MIAEFIKLYQDRAATVKILVIFLSGDHGQP